MAAGGAAVGVGGEDDASGGHAGVFASSSLLKLVPGLGSAVNAAVAATITGAMGRFVRGNFEEAAIAKIEGRPAPALVFDVELFKKFYEEYQSKKTQEQE